MFSATVRLGQRFTSWYTVAIPASWAAPGEANTRSSPRTRMVPPSMPYTPVSALIKVDFPAPFSPMSACTSPGQQPEADPVERLDAREADRDVAHLHDRGRGHRASLHNTAHITAGTNGTRRGRPTPSPS